MTNTETNMTSSETNTINRDDLVMAAERLESAIFLLYEMQDEYFRPYEPNTEPMSHDNICILHEFTRNRKITNAIAELLQLIQDDFDKLDITCR